MGLSDNHLYTQISNILPSLFFITFVILLDKCVIILQQHNQRISPFFSSTDYISIFSFITQRNWINQFSKWYSQNDNTLHNNSNTRRLFDNGNCSSQSLREQMGHVCHFQSQDNRDNMTIKYWNVFFIIKTNIWQNFMYKIFMTHHQLVIKK